MLVVIPQSFAKSGKTWSMSFDALLQDPGLIFTFHKFIDNNIMSLDRVALFEQFLISEFSEKI